MAQVRNEKVGVVVLPQSVIKLFIKNESFFFADYRAEEIVDQAFNFYQDQTV